MKKTTSFMTLLSAAAMLFFVLAALPLISPASAAVPETSSDVAARLQQYYRQIDSLSFSFIQSTRGQMIGRPKTGRGNGIFVRTGSGPKMRWNYSSPDRQVLISDGETISMYFEELKQMIIAPVDQAQADILFSFFAGQAPLEDSFTILDSDPGQTEKSVDSPSDVSIIQLIPKNPDSQLASINLYVSPDSLIRRVELVDHFDTRTTITIADVSINPFQSQTPEEINQLFVFTPPEGTEIIRQ
ncbi:MAG: outer membrane lipoprotein carrier protein LolA [Desulfocapsaceae bacterium]|jgi:outer membrane lipoprotein carrier protein|nr:outer membrane lipoprotein carrier protein LolA [Desulfocapsaceae bacterium]